MVVAHSRKDHEVFNIMGGEREVRRRVSLLIAPYPAIPLPAVLFPISNSYINF